MTRRRILAVRQDNNGDVILTGPALRTLARYGEVTLVCGPSGEPAARLMPDVARVVMFRADWIEGSARPIDPAALERAIATIRDLDPDEAFIFTSFHQSPLPTALVLRIARVRRIHAISVDYPGSLLDTRCTVPDDIHEVERALALVAAAGYASDPRDDGRLRLRPLPQTRHLIAPRYIAVQPGATVEARRWRPERMRDVVATLSRMHRVAVLGSAQEADLARTVVGASEALDLSGKTTFAEFAAIIARADALVVGNSSGIHVAAATGTPVVTIFAPTIPPVRFAPWRVPSAVLGDHDVPCAGCRARVCPFERQHCIDGVSAADVVNALESLVALPARMPA